MRTATRLTNALLLLAAAFAGFGCNSVTAPVGWKYSPSTAPESVLVNLKKLFEHQDAGAADTVLTRDFVFRFLPGDINPGEADSVTRAEMDSFFVHLFVTGVPGNSSSPAADRIRFDYTILSKGDDNRIGHAGWKVYTIETTLTINFPNGNDLSVNSPARLYFRRDPAGSNRWRIAEWKDISGGSGSPDRRAGPMGSLRSLNTTWGKLLSMYR